MAVVTEGKKMGGTLIVASRGMANELVRAEKDTSAAFYSFILLPCFPITSGSDTN